MNCTTDIAWLSYYRSIRVSICRTKCIFSLTDPEHSSASPFWRAPQRETTPKKGGRDPNLVVGAAYSHADLLKIDSLYGKGLEIISYMLTSYQEPLKLRLPTANTAILNIDKESPVRCFLSSTTTELRTRLAAFQVLYKLSLEHER